MPHARPHRPGPPRLALAAALLAQESCTLELAGPGLRYVANTLDAYFEDRHEVFEPAKAMRAPLLGQSFTPTPPIRDGRGPPERITQDWIATLDQRHRKDPLDDWERGCNARIWYAGPWV